MADNLFILWLSQLDFNAAGGTLKVNASICQSGHTEF